MKRTNNKNYKAIIEAKNNIFDILEEDIFDLSSQEGIEELIYCLIRSHEISIREKVALWTVLESGSFVEDMRWGYSFMMPSTKACCENFAICEKHFKKGSPLEIFISSDEGYYINKISAPYMR